MSVSPMKKMTAVVMRSDADAVIRRLMWLSCVEVIPVDPGVDNEKQELAVSHVDAEYAEAERNVIRLERAVKTLKNYTPAKSKDGLFAWRPCISRERYEADIKECDEAYKTADRSEAITYRLAEINNDRIAFTGDVAALQPWVNCQIPLDMTGTKETHVWFGMLPKNMPEETVSGLLRDYENGPLPCSVEYISEDSSGRYVAVVYHTEFESSVYMVLSSAGFVKIDLKEYSGTAAENTARLKRKLGEADKESAELENELQSLAEKTDLVKIAYDVAGARFKVLAAKKKMFETRETIVLSGWVPHKAVDKVTAQLEKMQCCYEFNEPQKDDDVPVLLQNVKPASAFEVVVGLYSMPLYGSFDPTFIMSFFYFVIFGLMLGDVVYGLLLSAGGFLALKFLDLNPGVKRLVRMFAVCGIACMISGFLFGSYLGDLPAVFMSKMLNITIRPPAVLFDPIADPVLFLIIALAAGALHLAAGMCIKFYMLWISGKRLSAVFDVGSWFVLFTGIALIALNQDAGKYVALTGVAALVLTQGRAQKNVFMKIIKGVGSLYNIVNYAADLLSYSRIMALGMASAVIASVVNILATLAGPSVIGFIVMILVVLAGHTVNLAINLLGTFVHTSRLQYIEFFGKFFEDGGKLFKPLRIETKYTHAE